MRQRFAIAVATLGLILFGVQHANTASTPRAQLVSVTEWNIPQAWFGGFSGIEVSDDGSSFSAISDRGRYVRGHFQRKKETVQGVELSGVGLLRDKRGERFSRHLVDSEGLVDLGNGAFLVSFEGHDRVERFAAPKYHGKPLPVSTTFSKMEDNGAFEALAIDEDGVIYAIPEAPMGSATEATVFSLQKGQWHQSARISRDPRFKPVGADFGPDGRLYLLERAFTGWSFRSRVRRFDVEQGALVNETVLLKTIAGHHDNLEGLAVWQDSRGRIRLTMISDDNFRFVQRTEIVEYVLLNTP